MLFFSRERTISGLALIIKDRAISTYEPNIITVDELPSNPDVTVQDEKNRFTFRLYGSPLSTSDLGLLGMFSLLVAVIAWLITFYFLSQQRRFDREILQGIKRGQFYLLYQPVIHAETHLPGGFEALVRWKHPKLGLIPPDEFIPYCESQGLIAQLTQHIMTLAARDAHRLIDVVPKGTKLGLNISPLHMTLDGFKNDVLHFINMMPTEYLIPLFEITERSMVQHGGAEAIFDWLHAQGIEIAIDDFGTGHSALIYLQRYKIDYLKIDRGFVNSIGLETVTAPVLDAVLELAKSLNCKSSRKVLKPKNRQNICGNAMLTTYRAIYSAVLFRLNSCMTIIVTTYFQNSTPSFELALDKILPITVFALIKDTKKYNELKLLSPA